MYKSIKVFFFFLIINHNSFSMNAITKLFTSTSYNFTPGQTLTLVNNTSKTITAICQVTVVTNQIHSISMKVLNGSGQINGTSLTKGQTLVQTVYNTQVIPVTANSGAKAEFTNLGPYIVSASCW
ncbi:conserved protein of unknown function [Legionella fallonii LLAP-10]|uniref:Uncharacterized protein n=2 Tax=Legionella fallonii TaxID=96230 RepID=A0A098G6K5_9GAMM|nr:conserved protein of unknown function [Legionella fallonii LLAP-10]